jgi:tubulin-specific chaperone A
MPPASPLAIATSSVQRLIKEEASYHRELEQQTKRLQKLESEGPGAGDEENHAFLVKQEVCLLLPKSCLLLILICVCV